MNDLNTENEERMESFIEAYSEQEDGSFTLSQEEAQEIKNNPIYSKDQAMGNFDTAEELEASNQ